MASRCVRLYPDNKIMNKALHLFDENYILELFRENVLPLYPKFSGIEKVKVKPYKKMVWETTYHVVVGYDVYFTSPEGTKKLMLVCSAHSTESRDNVFQAMEYLWNHGFNHGQIDIPRPLFYSEYFRGTFYRGIEGENLLYYIKNKDYAEVERLLPLAAELFVRLHQLPAGAAANFNPINSRIKTVVPGTDVILKEMSLRYEGRFDKDLAAIYQALIEREEKYLHQNLDLKLIHGDAHTENIIKTGAGRVGLIDFTDFCLGDFARDLGTFLQQLEYKLISKNGDATLSEKYKDLFLSSYLSAAGLTLTPELQERIKLYYDWTTMRTAIFMFLKYDSDPARGELLLNRVKNDLLA